MIKYNHFHYYVVQPTCGSISTYTNYGGWLDGNWEA